MTFAELYNEFEGKLRRYAMSLVHDPDRADDLVQETFIRAMAHLPLLEQLNRHQRRAWLYRVLKNVFIDEQRARQREQNLVVVIGSLDLPRVLPNELLEQKIQQLRIVGGIKCHEENASTLLARLTNPPAKVTTIPAGFQRVDRPLTLDNTLLESLPAKRLYCTTWVQVDPEVDPARLEAHLEALISEELVICPVELKSVLARKCDLLKTRVVFYEGELWLVTDEAGLTASRFDYLEGKATLVVLGELTIDPEVDPGVLASRLAKVHNLGEIRCTPEQKGAIQARLGLSEGVLLDSTVSETAGEGMENVGYLAL